MIPVCQNGEGADGQHSPTWGLSPHQHLSICCRIRTKSVSFPHSFILANISRKTCTSYGFLLDLLQAQSFSLGIKLPSCLQHCLCQKPENLPLDRLIPNRDTSRFWLLY